MAISKFKITRAPKRATLTIASLPYVLNQEYPISLQSSMVIGISNLGEPYDDFGFKLGNENGTWSQAYNAIINGLVASGTPALADFNIDVKQNENTELLSYFSFDNATDRIKIIEIAPKYGELLINGSNVVLNKVYMLYEITSIVFSSNYSGEIQNIVSTLKLRVGNKTEYSIDVTINLISTANMISEINPTAMTNGTLTVV